MGDFHRDRPELDDDLHVNLQSFDYLNPSLRANIISMFPKQIQAIRYSKRNRTEPLPTKFPLSVIMPNLPIFEAMQDWLYEHDRYKRVLIKTGPLKYIKEHADELPNELNIGLYAATDKKAKIKYVNRIPYTPTELATAYLGLCQFSANQRLRVEYDKKSDVLPTHLHPVHYYSGPTSGELAYIDMKFAYWQILWCTTIDMQYNWRTQEIESEGMIPYIRCDEFAKQKEIRNVLNTLYNYKRGTVWNPQTRKTERREWKSPLYRPYNYAYILQVFHAIVNDVKNHFHLLQWLTDAAILPASELELVLEFLFEEWFMDARLEAQGMGRSNSTNMYKVGDPQENELSKVTKHYDPDFRGRPYSNLWNSNIEGLKAERSAMTHEKPLKTPKPSKPTIFSFGMISRSTESELKSAPVKIKKAPNPNKGKKGQWLDITQQSTSAENDPAIENLLRRKEK